MVLAVLATALILLWFAALPGRALLSPDEGRYASLSLGMLHSGDWVTPRLNGLLYFEKPPLQYWAGATAMAIFGINEFAARLWPGLAGIATVILVATTAAALWSRRAGVRAFFVAAATTWISGNSHFINLDSGLCAALTLTLCAVLRAEHAGFTTDAGRRWVLAAWLGIGLGLLSKGPVAAVLPGAVLVVHSLWRRDLWLCKHLRWVAGPLLALAVAAPWFVLVSLRNPGFAWFFFVHEHLDRYLTDVHQRDGAWWYFVPVVLGGLLPWTGALPWLLRPHRRDFARSLLLVWAVVIFVFFSFSHSKLSSYILPIFPALALLGARELEAASGRTVTWIVAVPTIFWAIVLATLPIVDRFVGSDTPPAAVRSFELGLGAGAALFLCAAAAAFALLRLRRRTVALALVATAHFTATLLAMQSHDTFGQLKSAREIARAVAPVIGDASPVFAVRSYDQTLPFYLRRPVVLVDYHDEFSWGEAIEPARWIVSLDGFVERWSQETRAAAYMAPPTFDELRARGVPMRVVFADARRIVVVKPSMQAASPPSSS